MGGRGKTTTAEAVFNSVSSQYLLYYQCNREIGRKWWLDSLARGIPFQSIRTGKSPY
jgi:hypothetical protein